MLLNANTAVRVNYYALKHFRIEYQTHQKQANDDWENKLPESS